MEEKNQSPNRNGKEAHSQGAEQGSLWESWEECLYIESLRQKWRQLYNSSEHLSVGFAEVAGFFMNVLPTKKASEK